MSKRLLNLLFAVSFALLLSCKPRKAGYGSEDGELKGLFETTTGYKFEYPDGPIVVPPANSVIVDITQPELLAQIEDAGYHITNLFSRERFGASKRYASNNEFLQKSPWYSQIVELVSGYLDALHKTGQYVFEAKGMEPRLFNRKWFVDESATYELIAIVNRTDRMDFAKNNCGEVRFVYRMSYLKKDIVPQVFSRLPLVFNVVYEVPKSLVGTTFKECVAAASKWVIPSKIADGQSYFKWLTSRGSVLDLGRYRFKQVEINMQAVRIPSESASTLGGHAEYLLRVFAPDAGGIMRQQVLENTPDVQKLKGDLGLRRELIQFIANNVTDIDNGVVKIPEKFLARQVTGFTTYGVNRLGNKPFSQLLKPIELKEVDFSKAKFIGSAEALLARLDDLTCTGCHQGSSVAGFHLLGIDRPSRTHPMNALRVPFSGHFMNERLRRKTYNSMLVGGKQPLTFRPLSFQPNSSAAAFNGSRCLPEGEGHKFKSSWSCAEGLKCESLFRNKDVPVDVGMCVSTKAIAGDACLRGEMETNPVNARFDKFRQTQFKCFNDGFACQETVKGVPGGLCTKTCEGAQGFARDPETAVCA